MSFRKHHEKATAESIQVTTMPIIQLPELSVEDEAFPPKSPGKSQYSDRDHTLIYYTDATPYQEHEIDFQHDTVYALL